MTYQNITITQKLNNELTVSIQETIDYSDLLVDHEKNMIEVERALSRINETIVSVIQKHAVNMPSLSTSPVTTDYSFGGYLSTVTWQGKTYVKYFGGRWVKFGVNVWPEVLKASGIEASECIEKYRLDGKKIAIAYDENGKPKRVTAITQEDTPF